VIKAEQAAEPKITTNGRPNNPTTNQIAKEQASMNGRTKNKFDRNKKVWLLYQQTKQPRSVAACCKTTTNT
jgi:hypothetical protein